MGSWPAAGWGGAAALATVGGLLAFYRALAGGPVAVVSPLIAVVESAVPVVVAAAAGDPFAPLTWVAIGVALVAGALMSGARGGGRARPGTLALALASGIGLGLSVVLLDWAPAGAGQVPAFADLAGGLVVLVAVAGAGRRAAVGRRGRPVAAGPPSRAPGPSGPAGRRWLGPPAAAGVLLGAANVLLVLALPRGDLAVVGVLVSLYPAATIALARVLDGERPTTAQWAGVGAALTASALLAPA